MPDDTRRTETLPYWSYGIQASDKRRPDDDCATDSRSTEEVLDAYSRALGTSDSSQSLAAVHYRGGPAEFEAGCKLLGSANPNDRIVGADVLAQLGWQDRTFLEPSIDALLPMLSDPDEGVIQAAMIALGHRASPRAIDPLLPFVTHPSADIRNALVHGLMPHDTPRVVAAMIRLSGDADRYTRDWATFTLGSQFSSDSPELRSALHARVTDEDAEIRGEALRGLARRGDRSILPVVLRELEGPFEGDLGVEAAEHLADPSLLPALRALPPRLSVEDQVRFMRSINAAIEACAD